MHRSYTTVGLGAIATLGLGVPFWLIAVAQQAMSTATMAAVRVSLAALTLVVVPTLVRRRQTNGPWREIAEIARWRPFSLLTVSLGAPVLSNLLIGAAERHVPTGTTAVILATTPIWIALIATVRPDERLHARQCFSLPAAVVGVSLVCAAAVPRGALLWCLLPLAASFCYAVSAFVLSARLAQAGAITVSAAEMVLATLVLVPVAIMAGGQLRWDPAAWAAVVAAGVGCSGLGWLANTALIQRVGAARSSIVAYTAVLISVTLGAALLHEPVTARVVVGVVVIVAAVAVFLLPAGAMTRLAAQLSRKERVMLELCILGFLAQTPMHSYELRRRIVALTGHVRPVSDGALSPATKRLEARGLLTRITAPGEGGPARVVLHLTDEGRIELLRRLAAADGADVTDRNRWFAVLAFLHHLADTDRQREVLERRLAFLEDPHRGFFVAGGDRASVFREGMATMAKATWRTEHAWLRRTLAALGT